MKIILIRHGESTANEIGKNGIVFYCGQYDCPLTKKGLTQAQALRGNPLLNDVDAIYISDLLRARQTAEAFANKEKIIIDSRIRERSLGQFEGKTRDELLKIPEHADFFNDPNRENYRHSFTKSLPGGENYQDVVERIRPFYDELLKKDYEKVVIVSHFVALRCLMKLLLNLSEEETINLKINNCEPIVIDL